MIIELLNIIKPLRHAVSIHYFNKYRFQDGFNLRLWKFSKELHDELYEGITPCKDWRYHVSKLVFGKVGDFIFENHTRYMHCSLLYSSKKPQNLNSYMIYIQILNPT